MDKDARLQKLEDKFDSMLDMKSKVDRIFTYLFKDKDEKLNDNDNTQKSDSGPTQKGDNSGNTDYDSDYDDADQDSYQGSDVESDGSQVSREESPVMDSPRNTAHTVAHALSPDASHNITTNSSVTTTDASTPTNNSTTSNNVHTASS